MKEISLFVLLVVCFICCKKKDNTVNNYYTVGSPQPAYVVNGVNDLSFISNVDYVSTLTLSVQYMDSAQENVALSLSGLPVGVTIDSTWINSGIPTFSTTLSVFDTNGTAPGTYPVTLTATTSSGKKKNYPFNVRILPMPTGFLGKYNTCITSCGGTNPYMDSVYADPSIPNKVWFSNFANSGNKVYALIGAAERLTIPSQTVGGMTYSCNPATITLAGHQMSLSVHVGAANCSVNMR